MSEKTAEALGYLFGALINIALRGFIVWVMWVPFVVETFHGPALTYWRAVCLIIVLNTVGESFYTKKAE